MIGNLEEANKALAAFVPSQKHTYDDYKLDRMRELMRLLGNPQNNLRVIHIAGTSGKTSTSYFITALLREAGMMVGTTVSPHVSGVNERVMIDGKPLQEELFCYYLDKFIQLVKDAKIKPTYFELIVAFAYWVFAREEVDYAVVETGLGGLLDGTNVVDREDKLCVITDIGLDHTHILGDTIDKIAVQKAGIIQKGNHVMILPQNKAVADIMLQRCKTVGALLHTVHAQDEMPVWLQDLPHYQQRNFSLALASFALIAQRDELIDITQGGLDRAAHIQIPGRMEKIEYQDKTLILDGAHNPQKMQSLAKELETIGRTRNGGIAAMVAMADDKDIDESLDSLLPYVNYVVCTKFHASQDLPKKPVDPTRIRKVVDRTGIGAINAEDPQSALQTLLQRPEDTLLVTGSLYLVSQIRAAVLTPSKNDTVAL